MKATYEKINGKPFLCLETDPRGRRRTLTTIPLLPEQVRQIEVDLGVMP